MAVHAESSIQLNTIPAYTSLLGGHFYYKSTATTLTPQSANVIQNVSNSPSEWQYNTHIGSNGIKLRYNEIDLSEWSATNGLKLYYPVLTNGVITNSQLGAQFTASDLSFYKPGGQTASAVLNSNGLNITEGSIILGSEDSTTHRHPFEVSSNGTLYAIDATIAGGITATSLTVAPNAVITDSTGRLDNDAIEVGGRNLMSEIDIQIPENPTESTWAYRINLIEALKSNITYTIQLWNINIIGEDISNAGIKICYCNENQELITWDSSNFDEYGYAEHLVYTFNRDDLNSIETYELTTDTVVEVGKNYYILNSSTGEYELVNNPSGNPSLQGWYEYYGSSGIIEIYHSPNNIYHRNLTIENFKLEKGNKPTEWSPAPEDTEDTLNNSINALEEADSLAQNQIGILEGQTEQLTSHIIINDNTLTLINGVNNNSSKLIVTATGITLKDTLDETIASFSTDIILGKLNEPHLQLTPNGIEGDNNPRLRFLQDENVEVAYISSNTLGINQARIDDSLQIGNFIWRQRENRISLVYIT